MKGTSSRNARCAKRGFATMKSCNWNGIFIHSSLLEPCPVMKTMADHMDRNWWDYIIATDNQVYIEDSIGRQAQCGHLVMNDQGDVWMVSMDCALGNGEMVFDCEMAKN